MTLSSSDKLGSNGRLANAPNTLNNTMVTASVESKNGLESQHYDIYLRNKVFGISSIYSKEHLSFIQTIE
jgi:hypothetical protein